MKEGTGIAGAFDRTQPWGRSVKLSSNERQTTKRKPRQRQT